MPYSADIVPGRLGHARTARQADAHFTIRSAHGENAIQHPFGIAQEGPRRIVREVDGALGWKEHLPIELLGISIRRIELPFGAKRRLAGAENTGAIIQHPTERTREACLEIGYLRARTD